MEELMLPGDSILDVLSEWRCCSRAMVMGQGFVAGEPIEGVRRSGWKGRRCSSVFTTVVRGHSRYGVVQKFIERCDGRGDQFAVVEWLPRPTYVYGMNPLVVRLRDHDFVHGLPLLVSICDFEPVGVCLERSEGGRSWFVMRTSGLDTFPHT